MGTHLTLQVSYFICPISCLMLRHLEHGLLGSDLVAWLQHIAIAWQFRQPYSRLICKQQPKPYDSNKHKGFLVLQAAIMASFRHPNVVFLMALCLERPSICNVVASHWYTIQKIRLEDTLVVSSLNQVVFGPIRYSIATEFCVRGSLYDVLRKVQRCPGFAQQLDWCKCLCMLLDAAKVTTGRNNTSKHQLYMHSW